MTHNMKRNFGWMVSALAVGAFLVAPISSVAQEDPSQKIVPHLELQQAEIRDALKLLFESVGIQNWSIANDVQGTITIKVTNLPFETVLRNILNQVGATWRVEAGVYQIVKREPPAPPPTGGGDTGSVASSTVTRKIQISHADPMLIALLLSGEQLQFNLPPELSTFSGAQFGGFGGGGFGGGGGGFGGRGGFGGGG
ncbi:MAG: hypothetical protein C4341_08385, partial [Armatimonadota bacterium]